MVRESPECVVFITEIVCVIWTVIGRGMVMVVMIMVVMIMVVMIMVGMIMVVMIMVVMIMVV